MAIAKERYSYGWTDPRTGYDDMPVSTDPKDWNYNFNTGIYISKEWPGFIVKEEDVDKYGTEVAIMKAKDKYRSTYGPRPAILIKDPAAIMDWESLIKGKRVTPIVYVDDYLLPVSPITTNPFLDKVIDMAYVGSRVSCNPPPVGTDEDILIFTDKLYRLVEDCKVQGFVGGEVYFKEDSTSASEFISLKQGDINLIVTENKDFYDKFLLATHVCKTLNVMEKVNRVMVFQAILYGNKTEGKP